MNRLAHRLALVLGLLAIPAFAWYAFHALQDQDLAAYTSPSIVVAIIAASVCYMLTAPASAIAWRTLLTAMGAPRPTVELLVVMSVSQMAKYLPGNIGAPLGRMAMSVGRGIPPRPVLASLLVESALALLVAMAVGLAGLWLAGASMPTLPPIVIAWIPPVALVLLLAMLATGPWLGRRLPPLPPLMAMLQASALYAGVYLFAGTGFWLLAYLALPGLDHSFLLLFAAFALSFVGGFLVPGAPAGLGVREGLLVLLISPTYSPSDALFLVLALRLATTAGDATLFAAGALAWLRLPSLQGPRPDMPPQTTQPIDLEPTGERMIMEHYRSSVQDHIIYLMHEATYRFAVRYCTGKRVLDYGCGSGYGSASMAKIAAHVTGVDIATDAIKHAQSHFKAPNLDFRAIDPAARLPFADNSFDTVLSFQVFEHVSDTDAYLREITRVLAPGGTLVLATPDRSTRLFPFQRPWNRWHVHEYSSASLSANLRRHFLTVSMLSMSASPPVARIEMGRARKIKWLSLPFTLSIFPDAFRRRALGAIHRLRGPTVRHGNPTPCPFRVEDITIAPGLSPSLNLVAIATTPQGPQ